MALLAAMLPPAPIDWVLARADFETTAAPLLALVAGMALTLSPISWPSVPAVVSLVTPASRSGTADGLVPEFGEQPPPIGRVRAALVVLGFVVGMDGVLAGLGAVAVSVTDLLVRGGVVLSLVAAALLAVVGVRLLTRRGSLCSRTLVLPPHPLRAVTAGTAFAVIGCPGCAPIAIGIGGAAAASGSVVVSMLAITGFTLGRWVTLYASALLGGRLLGTPGAAAWRRLDVVVGVLFVVGAAYYLLRVLVGAVVTVPAGTPGVLG